MSLLEVQTITGNSSASASTTTIVGSVIKGNFLKHNFFQIEASLLETAGGTINVYLQRKLEDDLWADWIAFPQLAAGSTARYYSTMSVMSTTIVAVGRGTDSSAGTPALAANTNAGGHPVYGVRMVCVTGTGVAAAKAQTIKLIGVRVRS